MKNLFFIILVLLLVGCSATSEFAVRKYRPGHYRDHSETVGSFNPGAVPPSLEEQVKEKNNKCFIDEPEKLCADTRVLDSVPAAQELCFYFSGDPLRNKKKEEIQDTKNVSALPDGELDRIADRSLMYGRLSLVTLFLFWLAALPLAIMAVANANTVLNHPESTQEQKRIARKGKTMGSIVIALFLIPLIVILLLIYWGVIKFP